MPARAGPDSSPCQGVGDWGASPGAAPRGRLSSRLCGAEHSVPMKKRQISGLIDRIAPCPGGAAFFRRPPFSTDRAGYRRLVSVFYRRRQHEPYPDPGFPEILEIFVHGAKERDRLAQESTRRLAGKTVGRGVIRYFEGRHDLALRTQRAARHRPRRLIRCVQLDHIPIPFFPAKHGQHVGEPVPCDEVVLEDESSSVRPPPLTILSHASIWLR